MFLLLSFFTLIFIRNIEIYMSMCNNFRMLIISRSHTRFLYHKGKRDDFDPFPFCVIWQSMKLSSFRNRKFHQNLTEWKFLQRFQCTKNNKKTKQNFVVKWSGKILLSVHSGWYQRCDCRENEFLVAFIPSMTLSLWWDWLG